MTMIYSCEKSQLGWHAEIPFKQGLGATPAEFCRFTCAISHHAAVGTPKEMQIEGFRWLLVMLCHILSMFSIFFHDKCFGLLCVRGVPGVLCKGHLHVPRKMQDRWSITQAPYWQPGQKPCWHRGGCEVRQIFGGKWRKHKRSTSLCEMQTIYRLRDKLNEFGDTVWKQT